MDPPASPGGAITEATLKSPAFRSPWRVIVYTPVGYRDDGHYPVAVFLDLRSGQMSRVLDWLIARRAIEPIVAVFVGPVSPGADHPAGGMLRTFLTVELPAWLTSRYSVSRTADRRAVIAISFGGKDALDAALASSSGHVAFDGLGLLIPGRRITRADIEAFASRSNHRLRVAILAGQYDRANLPTARSLRQALAEAGHAVDYAEVPEGHSAVTFTYHLRMVLVSLFGPSSGDAAPRGEPPASSPLRPQCRGPHSPFRALRQVFSGACSGRDDWMVCLVARPRCSQHRCPSGLAGPRQNIVAAERRTSCLLLPGPLSP